MPPLDTNNASFPGSPGHLLAVTTVRHGHFIVLGVSGNLDVSTTPHLNDAVHNAAATRPGGLIIDLTDTDFLASAGITALIHAHDTAAPGGEFAVVADGPTTAQPLRLVGLDHKFAIYPTLNDALAALR